LFLIKVLGEVRRCGLTPRGAVRKWACAPWGAHGSRA